MVLTNTSNQFRQSPKAGVVFDRTHGIIAARAERVAVVGRSISSTYAECNSVQVGIEHPQLTGGEAAAWPASANDCYQVNWRNAATDRSWPNTVDSLLR